MTDLSDQLRGYIDAVVLHPSDASAGTDPPRSPRRRSRSALAVLAGLAFVMLVAAMALVVRDARHSSLRVTGGSSARGGSATSGGTASDRAITVMLDVTVTDSQPPTVTVHVDLEVAGSKPVRVVGSLTPDPCVAFPVAVTAVRTSWEPGTQPWPGYDTYLGEPITGYMHSTDDPRALFNAFRDTLLPADPNAACQPVGRTSVVELQPGARLQRTFVWTLPVGWPGGSHVVRASVVRYQDGVSQGVPLTASAPTEIATTTRDQLGPAEALRLLGKDARFRAAVDSHQGISALNVQWSADRWTTRLKFNDSADATWTTSNAGSVSKMG